MRCKDMMVRQGRLKKLSEGDNRVHEQERLRKHGSRSHPKNALGCRSSLAHPRHAYKRVDAGRLGS